MFESLKINTSGQGSGRDRDRVNAELAGQRIDAGEFIEYLGMYGPHERTRALADIAHLMTESALVHTAREVWTHDDQPSANAHFWRSMLQRCAALPEVFMTADERKLLMDSSSPLTVFRGAGPREMRPSGFAWTLDPDKADFFAYTYRRGSRTSGHVFEATIEKADVLALLAQCGAADILIVPERVEHWRDRT